MAESKQSENNVFINCPFDDDYKSLFYATVFAVVACGFNARCAFEIDDGGQVRIEKLYDIIADCRFGVHDISRVELDPISNLPRFNMPLELGIFLGAKRYGSNPQRSKILLVHDRDKYRYQTFVSDIAGMDVKAHNNEPAKIIANVHAVLTTGTRRQTIPSRKRIQLSFSQFNAALPKLTHGDGLDHSDLLFAEMENLVVAWVKKDMQLALRP